MPITLLIKERDFGTLPNATNATPPEGYAKPAGSSAPTISGGRFNLGSGTDSVWYDTRVLSGDWVTAYVQLVTPATANTVGAALIDINGNGWMVITGKTSNNFRIFLCTNGKLAGSALKTIAVAPVDGAWIGISRNNSDGTVKIFQNGVQIGTDYPSAQTHKVQYAAAVSRGGSLAKMASEYLPSQAIDVINSGNPVTVGTNTATVLGYSPDQGYLGTGAAKTPLSGVVTYNGVTTFTVPDFVDGQPYFDVSQTPELTLLSSASKSTVFGQPAYMQHVVADWIITDDPTYLGYHLSPPAVPGDLIIYNNNEIAFDSGLGIPGGRFAANTTVTSRVLHWSKTTKLIHEYNITLNQA